MKLKILFSQQSYLNLCLHGVSLNIKQKVRKLKLTDWMKQLRLVLRSADSIIFNCCKIEKLIIITILFKAS